MSVSQEAADYVLDCVDGFQKSQVLNAACKLELFDVIHNHKNATVEALTVEKSWQESETRHLLDTLVSLRMLSKTLGKDGKYIYSNTDNGCLLRRETAPSLWGSFFLHDAISERFADIHERVKGTKKADHHHHHHHDKHDKAAAAESEREARKNNPWYTHSYGDGDENSRRIDMAVAKSGFLDVYSDQILSEFDLSKYRTSVDLGGGNGNLSRALCRKYPQIQATVIDMEDVIEIARKVHAADLKQNEVLNVEFVPGDFCSMDIPKADLYIMSQVSHHLTDEQWNHIMSAVYVNLPPGGAFLLLESYLSEEGDGPIAAHMFNLMVSSYHFINTSEGYKTSLKKFGFSDIQSSHIGGQCAHGIIFAVK